MEEEETNSIPPILAIDQVFTFDKFLVEFDTKSGAIAELDVSIFGHGFVVTQYVRITVDPFTTLILL